MDAREVPLPLPVTVEAWYLAAIFDEIKDLRAELNAARRLTPAEDPVTYIAPQPEAVAPSVQPEMSDDTQEFPAPAEESVVIDLREPEMPEPVATITIVNEDVDLTPEEAAEAAEKYQIVKPRKPPVRSQPRKRR